MKLSEAALREKKDPLLHALKVDLALGFDVYSIEYDLQSRARARQPNGNMKTWGEGLHLAQTWVGLSPKALQTPYTELSHMCDHLKLAQGKRFVDLGAGYGRMAHVLGSRAPHVEYEGFEIVPERVVEGNRVLALHNYQRAKIYEKNLASPDFIMPEADFYLIYDYGKPVHISHSLEQLSKIAHKHSFQLVGRGETTRSLIHQNHPWLWDNQETRHEERFSVYT